MEEIFDYDKAGSIKYLGTPAWKTHVDRNSRRLERGEMDAEEKFGTRASHSDHEAERVNEVPKET